MPLLAVTVSETVMSFNLNEEFGRSNISVNAVGQTLERRLFRADKSILRVITKEEIEKMGIHFSNDLKIWSSFEWPIRLTMSNQLVPVAFEAYLRRMAAIPRCAPAELDQVQCLAIRDALNGARLTEVERYNLTNSLHWSM